MSETKKYDLSEAKMYCHIDYDDDDPLLELMYETCIQEMKEQIPLFDESKVTSRQKLIIYCMIKDMYDNRELYKKSHEQMRAAVSSLLLKETLNNV